MGNSYLKMLEKTESGVTFANVSVELIVNFSRTILWENQQGGIS